MPLLRTPDIGSSELSGGKIDLDVRIEIQEESCEESTDPSLTFMNLTVGSFEDLSVRFPTPVADPKPAFHRAKTRRRRSRRKRNGTHDSKQQGSSPFQGYVRAPNAFFLKCEGQIIKTGSALVDRAGMWKSLFPRPRSEIGRCFWRKVDTVYMHVAGNMDWETPVPITSQVVLGLLFSRSKSVMIPLRDMRRVEHAWSILSLSGQPEVVRLRKELETAVSSVVGPRGCRAFPYRSQREYEWEDCLNRWKWCWLYMRYLGQDWDIPFLKIWTNPKLTIGRRIPKYAWVAEELTIMPKVQEVMFICIPGFEPPAGKARSDPSIIALDEDRDHTPLSPEPRHEFCSYQDGSTDKHHYKSLKHVADLSQYPFIISTPENPAHKWPHGEGDLLTSRR